MTELKRCIPCCRKAASLSRTTASLGALAFVFLALMVWSGCDTVETKERRSTTIERQGITYHAVGDAVLSLGPGGEPHVVSRAPGSGVLIETAGYRRGNLFFRPVTIGAGGAFSMALVSTGGKPLARVLQYRPTRDEVYHLAVDLSGLGAEAFTLVLRDEDRVVYRKEGIRLRSDTTVAATTDEEPTSYHYIEDGDDIIIEVDYENAEQDQLQKASVTPVFGEETEAFQVTHVAFIPEGRRLLSPQIAGVRMTGVQEIAIVEERFK